MKKLIFIFVIGSLLLSGCSRKAPVQETFTAPIMQSEQNPQLPSMIPWWRK